MYKRILLAYDGSKSGQQALLECGEIAQWSHAALTLLAVTPLYMDVIGVEGGVYDRNLAVQQQDKYQDILDDGLRQLVEAGHNADGELLLGDIIEEITKSAKKIDADLIVVGHKHVDGWAARWWRGSISKSLIEESPCSVLVVIIH